MDVNYKPNSHRSKEEVAEKEKKEITKVTTGKVVQKKNSARKFKDVFVSEDAKNVGNYIFMDVLIPAMKKTLSEIVSNGIDMLLYGETKGKRGNSSNVSYRNYYETKNDRSYSNNRTRSGYDYDDIILESRGEAEDVLNNMDGIIDSYGVVSVADLYDLVGITCNYTDNKYGWTNLRNADIIRVRNGYLLKLPKALPLN